MLLFFRIFIFAGILLPNQFLAGQRIILRDEKGGIGGVTVTLNGELIKPTGDQSCDFVFNKIDIPPPYDIFLEKEGYVTLHYKGLRNIPFWIYMIRDTQSTYWSEGIRKPMMAANKYIAVVPAAKATEAPEPFKQFLDSLGLKEATEYTVSIGAASADPSRYTSISCPMIVEKTGGGLFRGTDEVFAVLRASAFVMHAGPWIGNYSWISNQIYSRFDYDKKAEAERVIRSVFGEFAELKETVLGWELTLFSDMGTDMIKIVESLQGQPPFWDVSIFPNGCIFFGE